MIKDYDCVIDYHSGRVNMVADALSRKWKVAIRELGEWNKKILMELKNIDAQLEVGLKGLYWHR